MGTHASAVEALAGKGGSKTGPGKPKVRKSIEINCLAGGGERPKENDHVDPAILGTTLRVREPADFLNA